MKATVIRNMSLTCEVRVAEEKRPPQPFCPLKPGWPGGALGLCPRHNPPAPQSENCLYSFTCTILVSSKNPCPAWVT